MSKLVQERALRELIGFAVIDRLYASKGAKMSGGNPTVLQGLITELDVFGWGPNSAQLEFSIAPDRGPTQTFVVESGGGGTEPQVFAAMATILTAAFYAKKKVTITIPANQPPHQTPQISGIRVSG